VFRERQTVRPGENIRLRPRTSAVHLFDKETGKRL
jgi:multiple sugar transport system ATP-binding protein